MLKIVVFDSGYGGEVFADELKEELPIVDIIRVIDWRHAAALLASPKEARKTAKEALKPYIGKVDLIVFANHLLSATSLKHFRRRYKNQLFTGLKLKVPEQSNKTTTIILTTKAVARTINYYNYLFRLHKKATTLVLDSWPAKIDDGELSEQEIKSALDKYINGDVKYTEVILACSQFSDLKPELRRIFGRNLKIYDSTKDTIKDVYKLLKLRGSAKKFS